MAYTVGELDLDFTQSGNKDIAKSIQALITKLNKLYKTLDQFSSNDKVSQTFTKLTASIAPFIDKVSSAETSLTALDRVLTRLNGRSLSKVMKEGMRSDSMKEQVYYANNLNKEYLQMEKTTTTSAEGISKVTRKFNQQGKVVNEVTEEIDKYGNKIKRVSDSNIGFNLKNTLFSVGKILVALRVVTRAARRLGQIAADIVQYGSDYAETLNLWQVAMRGMNSQAQEFVNTMSKAYGISEKTLMENQAIFKNMIGSLGEISDEASYKLSEAITGMALDYASLYNITFEQAATKFQAALAGQVRPIRTRSGTDVTETTLYEMYRGMGGEKTMRQLNRTEKQLLAIYAVFEQMKNSGATGDMKKTIDYFANQSRMLSENWKQLLTYVGLLLKAIIEQTKLLPIVNALLMTASEIVKSIVYMLYPNTAMPNFLENMFEDAEDANEATDKLLGKLFSFDKFNAAKSSTGGVLGIDEKIINTLSNYTSKIKEASNSARELADKWLKILGLTKETWYTTIDQKDAVKITAEEYEKLSDEAKKSYVAIDLYTGNALQDITNVVKELVTAVETISIMVGVLIGYKLIGKISLATKGIGALTTASQLFATVGLFLIISSVIDLIKNWKELTTMQKVFKFALLAVGVAMISASIIVKALTADLTAMGVAIYSTMAAVAGLVAGFVLLGAQVAILIVDWKKMETWEKVVGILGAVASAALIAAAAIAAFHGAWTMGTAAVAIVAGLAAIAAAFVTYRSSLKDLGKTSFFADGGIPDKGTLFWAGEAGAEAVADIGGGRTGVMNVRQMEEAVARGVARATESRRDSNVNGTISINIGGTNFVNITQRELAKQGYKLVKV